MAKLFKFDHAKQKPVLLLNLNNEECRWESEFHALNWHCIHSSNITETIAYIKEYDIKVAIAMISSTYQQCVFKTLSKIFEVNCNMVWIAISCDNQFAQYPLSHQFPDYFFDYHHLPINWDKLGHTLGHAYGMQPLKIHSQQEKPNHGDEILGKSNIIKHLKSDLHKISYADGAVLISGETGTGKGLCANTIHRQSCRKRGPFITINCGALPSTLLHSELFGHEKGAFTGANKLYIGHIERAHKGTLFLDEIGDLTLDSQVHLLQFLEDHKIERLGANHTITIDCRIIFASHVNLETAVEEGRFREDLYHRLNILRIHVPSLRERREDIELLANYYLQQYSPEFAFAPQTLESMLRYEWPGNMRELKNRIQRAAVMADSCVIHETDMGMKVTNNQPTNIKLSQQRIEIDTEVLLAAINRHHHNISATAKELNISRTTFYRLVKKCKIKL
jgi:DNA-binding NtrC family response regulator